MLTHPVVVYCASIYRLPLRHHKRQEECGGRGGLVVERRTPGREVGDSILTQIAVLYP